MEKIKLFIRGFGSVLFFSALLFLCAGKIHYIQGWIYFSTSMITMTMTFISLQNDDELLKERSNAVQGASWDKLILGLSALIFLVTLILSGFDTGRFEWSPKLHWSFYMLGIFLTISGHSIFLVAQKENKYFSAVYRIQTDRGHTVCDTGIYKTVRHPGYSGMIISLLGLPLLTGSLWSYIPTFFAIFLLLIRTYTEDKALTKELNGYSEYKKRTHYKLIPFIW